MYIYTYINEPVEKRFCFHDRHTPYISTRQDFCVKTLTCLLQVKIEMMRTQAYFEQIIMKKGTLKRISFDIRQ